MLRIFLVTLTVLSVMACSGPESAYAQATLAEADKAIDKEPSKGDANDQATLAEAGRRLGVIAFGHVQAEYDDPDYIDMASDVAAMLARGELRSFAGAGEIVDNTAVVFDALSLTGIVTIFKDVYQRPDMVANGDTRPIAVAVLGWNTVFSQSDAELRRAVERLEDSHGGAGVQPQGNAASSSDDASIDKAALSAGLDWADLETSLDEWYTDFTASAFVAGSKADDPQRISVLSIENNTTEQIFGALRSLITSAETNPGNMGNSGAFVVVPGESVAPKGGGGASGDDGDDGDDGDFGG